MNDPSQKNQELITEISVLKKRIQELEQASSERIREGDERRSRQMAVLHEIGNELVAELNLEALLQSIARHALNMIGGASCNCYLYNPQTDLMERVITTGTELIPSPRTRGRGEGMVGQVWEKGTALLVNDYASWPGRTRAYDAFPSRALVAVPLHWGNEILGVLNIIAPVPQQYTRDDVEMLSLFATQAAIAIRNARIHDRLQTELAERRRVEEEQARSREVAERLANEMAVIARIGRIISSTLDIDEVYERFAAEARKLIAFDRIVVNLNDPQRNIIYTTYTSGLDVPGRRPGEVYPLPGSVNEVLARRRTGIINRLSTLPETQDQLPGLGPAFQAGIRSIVAVPLISRDAVIGGLHFHSRIPGIHTEEDLRLAERIGAQIAGAIDNAQLFGDFNRAAASLRESESRFRAIFEQAAVGVAEIETGTGRLLAVNRQLCEIVGRSREELLATTAEAITHPDDRHLQEEKMAQLLSGKIGHYSLEKRYLRKDGGIVWVNLTSSPLWKPGEPPTRNLIVVQDITERRRADAEMKSLQERLQRAEKMEALGTLAGGVAHDLNNVLGIVVGYAELLLNEVDPASPIRRRIMNIMAGGQKAAAIVQDLLTLARRGVTNRQVLNLNQIVMDCRNSPEFETLCSHHPAVRIRTDLEPDILNISGSSVHLNKTLFNLVSNANEAMPNGGLLTIRTANRYLDRPIQGYDEVREGDYVVLSVSDTGKGIAAPDLKRIFEPFYTKKVMGRSGTGLGLAVVWGTVKDHQGYITVQSEEGKGSTFTLYFPVTREEVSAGHAAVSPAEYLGRGESILIVDDVQGQRDLAAEMLRSLNYTVESVASGEEAVAYLRGHRADLLVLDMIMEPGMDGLSTYEKVLEIHPGQKAVIVSGFSESERVNAAQALGAGAYVRKPYVTEKLGLAVRSELDRDRT